MHSKNTGNRADFEAGRQRFLDAADRVFIREGYTRSTIRTISAEAGTGLARLNRHWTSKKHLFTDVLTRHFAPITNAQESALNSLPPDTTIHDIVAALVTPALTGSGADQHSREVYCKAVLDPAPEARAISTTLTRNVREALSTKLRQVLPDVSEEVFFFALTTIIGAFVYPLVRGQELAGLLDMDVNKLDWQQGGELIARFLAEGIR